MEKREIKFQIIRDNEIVGMERLSNNGWEWMYYALNPDNGERWFAGVIYPDNGYIRRQFTGRKDKDGKDIYDGDIVQGERVYRKHGDTPRHTKKITFEVVWNCERAAFVLSFLPMKWAHILGDGNDMPYEIIGNIYQNPSLLTTPPIEAK